LGHDKQEPPNEAVRVSGRFWADCTDIVTIRAIKRLCKAMKKIPLSGIHGRGRFALVDDEDHETLTKYSWALSGGRHPVVYAGV
jgi:hypothetical protein